MLVCFAVSSPHISQSVFGRMAEPFQPRKIEEPAIAFDCMHKAKDCIETRLIPWIRFPSDNLALDSLHHIARFGDKIG